MADILKNRIKSIAKDLFSKWGYSKVTTDEISSALGISKRTLYNFFESKEKLLEEIIQEELSKIEILINDLLKKAEKKDFDFIDTIKQMFKIMSEQSQTFTKEFFDDLFKSAPEQLRKIEEFREKHFKENFFKFYNMGVDQGFVKKHIDKNLFYFIFYHSFHQILKPEILMNFSKTANEIIEQIIDILLTGSLTEKGLVRIKN